MQYYLLVFLSVIGLAANFCLTKLYQNHAGAGMRVSVIFNIITGAFTAAIFFIINGVMNGFSLEITSFSLLMAALLILFCGAYALIGFKIISIGSMAVYTMFLMLGGMMLPYFFGLIYLNEEFSYLRLVGLALMVVAIALSGGDGGNEQKKKHSLVFFSLCLIVFCLNGGGSIVSKIHQLPQNEALTIAPTAFVMLAGIIRFLSFSLLYLGLWLRDRRKPREDVAPIQMSPKIVGIMFAFSAVDGLSYLLQLIGAAHLPASVLYPMITGGSVVLTAIAGLLFFKQKLSARAIVGIALCFIATLLFL